MELTIAVVLTLAGHLAVTVWWASRMDSNVKHLVRSVDTLVRQGDSHGVALAQHETRITVLEARASDP